MGFKNAELRRKYVNNRRRLIKEGTWKPNQIYKKGEDTECKVCGKFFYRSPSNKRTKNIYCSAECMSHAFMGRKSVRDTRIKIKCVQCKKYITRPIWHIKQSGNAFCDMTCFGNYKSEKWVGKDNPAWMGGKFLYYGENWVGQQKKVRQRDNHKCRCCGIDEANTRRNLDVHHIIPFRLFKNKKIANRLSNLISLCERCHKIAEKISKPGIIKSITRLLKILKQ